ncbi:hypothetical protein [Chryseobacterium koreense]|uniref:Uncharacterized protein n=1 Tax=Chryseobacterium koreense CCUG 49689 TaxID=1304281 RepID=A0A0J7IZK7_9FLAO|nr:hypothetical protein [Chryseobacterium koreense]KMQ71452.1 hypothetical protein ACM44_06360 [Chryseobacterium koreense CCUG 49689]MBB5333712.1 hypothetical protein [Chryseobacterium koreense]
MAKRLSVKLGVNHSDLLKYGVFDGFTDIDSRLHIDPSLLKNCKIPEFSGSYEKFRKYFSDTIKILKFSKFPNDRFFKDSQKRLTFKEIGNTALGYSDSGTKGNAIGKVLAGNILATTKLILDAGIEDPEIFELIGVLEKGVGADRISDMTLAVLIRDFLEYTQRVSKDLQIKTTTFKYGKDTFLLPSELRKPLIFVPTTILNDLPMAEKWSDIDVVCAYNEQLRKEVSEIIGATWKDAMKIHKSDLRKYLIDNPIVLSDLIQSYKNKPKNPYNFIDDPLGEVVWADLSSVVAEKYPLLIQVDLTSENIFDIVKKICLQFGSLIENNGWFEYLYNEQGKLKHERASQLLFYGVSEAYCEANNLDLNRETNAGVGSLDFKISKGYNAKVNVEIKYSSNPNLLKGFERQLPTYNRAEKTDHSILLVIKTTEKSSSIDNLLKVQEVMLNKNPNQRIPEIIVIDGTPKKSASKRK